TRRYGILSPASSTRRRMNGRAQCPAAPGGTEPAGTVVAMTRLLSPDLEETRARSGAAMPRCLPYVAIAVVAFLARLLPTLRGGGLLGMGVYDDGVHFTAAAALLAGRTPYADFVLLHPPGIVVALTPFALLGRLTSDPTGFAVAR